jgi:cellulose synthase operon protein C
MNALALFALLVLSLAAPDAAETNPLVSKAKEKEQLIQKLRRDIFKVDRAIGETEKLIAKSRNAPYLPDLQFRLAELYVEKSRYVYYLQAETRPEGQKGAMISPETKLLKEKAQQMYHRLLREHPDFADADKVTFYLAHEQRELGQFDEMLKTMGDLIRKYPKSPLRLEAEQILGDYFFAKADLTQAEKHYQAVIDAPPSPVHDLARYKLGWIRINQAKHADAVTYFEAAAASPPLPGVDPTKALNVKREALLDLVYSYTEARPGKGALNYFEKLSDSRATYVLALDKLGTRYFIKQQYEFAIAALRRLMELQHDPEMDVERAQRIYDSLKLTKGKVLPEPDDVRFLVRAAISVKVDPVLAQKERQQTLTTLEEMARDLSTGLHLAAQKKDDKELYARAGHAYGHYLSLFRPDAQVRTMMRNRADALFAAKLYAPAARQFEELARYEARAKDAKGHESALYGALLAHFSALGPGEAAKLDAFEVVDARQALKLMGASFISRYPKSENAASVKFNIARAFYDDGEFERSAELFTAFALSHPAHKDAPVAGHLALDSLRQRYDFKGLEETGRKLLAAPLPQAFLTEVREIVLQSRAEALGELALRSTQETGDVVQGLVKVAEENKGKEIGEKALYGAFSAAREKRENDKQRELGAKFVAEYPASQLTSAVLLTLGQMALETARFAEAASYYEQVGKRLGSDGAALDGWLTAARLRLALGDHPNAVRSLDAAVGVGGGRKAEVLALLAQAWLKANEPRKARVAAEQALKVDPHSAEAAALVAEVQATTAPDEPPASLVATLTRVAQGPNGQTEETARGIWYLAEILYRGYKKLPHDDVEQKVAQLQQLEGLYSQAASLGSAEWAVASLWRLGMAYQHLVDVVEGSPVPDGLSAGEVEQFRAAVKQQVAPLRARADNAFKACNARAASLEVFSRAVPGCRDRAEEPRPRLPTASPRPSAPGVDELLRRLEANPTAQGLEALGLAYLEAHQVGPAQLALGRAVELDDNRPIAHNGLGLALLLSGDPMGARAAYGRALDADPTFEKARANLAALRCRFGDKEGARRELSVLKAASLSGGDLDPEWGACR